MANVGWFDLLGGGRKARPRTGTFRLVESEVYVPGATAGEVYVPGAREAAVYIPGASAGQIQPE